MKAAPGLIRLRFIDQQDWNVIVYPVLQSARRTPEFQLIFVILQIASTFRADEDLQQGRIERHFQAFREGTGYPSSLRRAGFLRQLRSTLTRRSR